MRRQGGSKLPEEDKDVRLTAYVQEHVSKDPRARLDLDSPLITSGLVDSLSLISILAFIEDEFGVVIPDEAATAAAMDTIGQILVLIDAYAAETPR